MKVKTSLLAIFLILSPVQGALALPGKTSPSYREAVSLYEHGVYDRARMMFEQINSRKEDPMSAGYAILCAIALKSQGYEELIDSYTARWGYTPVASKIYLGYGYNLFDEGRYAEAAAVLDKLKIKSVPQKDRDELLFKRAYCDYTLGDYVSARSRFTELLSHRKSEYTAPAHFACGYMAYSENDFAGAFPHFEASAEDPRFAAQSSYYLLECKFMLKDYLYVSQNGEQMFENVPEERRPRLARILSESFLVQGNPGKAKKYYDLADIKSSPSNPADAFYAGSLQYSLGNYREAISNYLAMGPRTGANGQVASYQLGYSFIQVKDKVSAMDAFREASVMDYDARIKEDAMLNHAKLAFDLNHDASVFKKYLASYPESGRGDMIWDYIAVASLFNHDYAGAIEAYDNIDSLTPDMRLNYLKANYLRARQMVYKGSWRDAVPNLKAATFFTGRQDNINKLSRYWLAECNYKMGNYSEAITLLSDLYNQSALDNRPEGKRMSYDLAYCYFQSGEYPLSAQWFDRYIASGDRQCREDAYLRRADCDFLAKDYKAAIESYGAVLAEFPISDNLYPRYQQGICYGLIGKKKEKIAALSDLSNYTPSAPFYSETLYELGRSYVAGNKTAEAKRCFENLLATSRDSSYMAKSLVELGMIARNSSQNATALSHYKRVVEQFPGTESAAAALLAIESIYQAAGEPEKFIAYEESVGGKARSTMEKEAVYFSSAEQVFMTGNYEKALVAIDKYIDNYPFGAQMTRALYYKAESLKALDEKEKACDCYSKVLAAQDSQEFRELSLLNLANLSYALEHFTEAYSAYSSLLSAATLEGNALTAKKGMMRSAYGARKFQEAIDAAAAVSSDPSSTAVLAREADYITAKSLLSTSRRDEAFEKFRVLAATPSDNMGAEAAYLVIQDLYDRGRFEQVEQAVYKFAETAPGQAYYLAKSFIVLGDTFAENGNLRQARATFESVLNGYEPDPSSPDDVLESVKMRISKLDEMEAR